MKIPHKVLMTAITHLTELAQSHKGGDLSNTNFDISSELIYDSKGACYPDIYEVKVVSNDVFNIEKMTFFVLITSECQILKNKNLD